ncbi:hypothetical protein E2C01_043561 [Portunus trituberculatus]|uniref:Uncharacterized protein n=1 Tax=Portunus trituberculatus TaxID=210409 RepID=A0A5B7FX16_PORTR|nr:hypothetical protein [Portunus trituberculatus]
MPCVHDVSEVPIYLAFLRTHSLDQVHHRGQWRTALAFVSCYLHPMVTDALCGFGSFSQSYMGCN